MICFQNIIIQILKFLNSMLEQLLPIIYNQISNLHVIHNYYLNLYQNKLSNYSFKATY